MFATFKEVCIARGLLEDDHEWRICLEEAVAIQPGMVCRRLLAVILLTDEVTECQGQTNRVWRSRVIIELYSGMMY